MASEDPSSSRASTPLSDDDNDFPFRAFFSKSIPRKTPNGRQKGRRTYRCIHCSWENSYKNNCRTHARAKHRRLIQQYETSPSSQGSRL
ncbi:hypothetical protein V1517DRAFT_334782, partial [Lipomyces orientalis]